MPDLDLATLDATAIVGIDPSDLDGIAERSMELLETEKEIFNL